MSRRRQASLAVAVGLLCAAGAARANLVTNPGFEVPGGLYGAQNWHGITAISSSPPASATVSLDSTDPHSGAYDEVLSINHGESQLLSDPIPVNPSDTYTLTFYTKSAFDNGATFNDAEVYLNYITNGVSYRGVKSYDIPQSASYIQNVFNVGAIPQGVDHVKLEFDTFNANSGTIHIDDVSFDAVPEPASAGLLVLSAMLICGRRARRSCGG